MTDWVAPSASPPQPAPAPAAAAPATADSTTPLAPPPVAFRPLGVLAILDGAFMVLKRRPREVLALSAGFVVVTQVVLGYLYRDSAALDPFATPSGDEEVATVGAGETVVSFLASSLELLFPTAVLSLVVVHWLHGRHVSVADAARQLVRRLHVLLGAWVLVHVIQAVAAIALIIGTVVAIVLLQLVTPVIAVEGAGVVESIRRSIALVRGRLGPAILVPVLLGIVQQITTVSLQTLALVGVAVLPSEWDWIAFTGVAIVIELLFLPVWASAMALLYVDARVRLEGFDLQERTRRAFEGGWARG